MFEQQLTWCLPTACSLATDLKPGNILVNSAGHAKISDFGLAREASSANTNTTLVQTGEDGGCRQADRLCMQVQLQIHVLTSGPGAYVCKAAQAFVNQYSGLCKCSQTKQPVCNQHVQHRWQHCSPQHATDHIGCTLRL